MTIFVELKSGEIVEVHDADEMPFGVDDFGNLAIVKDDGGDLIYIVAAGEWLDCHRDEDDA